MRELAAASSQLVNTAIIERELGQLPVVAKAGG
jgi:hypothetical protein